MGVAIGVGDAGDWVDYMAWSRWAGACGSVFVCVVAIYSDGQSQTREISLAWHRFPEHRTLNMESFVCCRGTNDSSATRGAHQHAGHSPGHSHRQALAYLTISYGLPW